MKRTAIMLMGIALLCGCSEKTQVASGDSDERYFGLHFDFHASPQEYYKEHPVGETLKEEDIREICNNMKIDFLQVDCKGHPGWASYPSKCGNGIPQMKDDPLKTWRKVTDEEGVKLFLHYSGVVDYNYLAKNPDQGVMYADGTRSKSAVRTNGKYVDDLLIPQLRELAGDYGIDGMWIDGDCWAASVDFDPETVAAFQSETGIDLKGKLPTQRGMPYFNEYRDYCRELFRRYVAHYVDVLHSEYPSFRIASNWSYTDHMPEEILTNVNYISGDLAPSNSYWWARFSGRTMEKQDKVGWDLMAWGFRSSKEQIYKTPAQLMQEASAVIALGGGFQVYITQQIDGSPRMDKIRKLYPLADFMNSRKPWCFKGHMEHQVAVLLSTFDRHREAGGLFSRDGIEKTMNTVNMLVDAGHSVSIVSEHDLTGGKIDSYPVIVVPNLYEGLEENTMDMITEYVKNGGCLIIQGPNATKLFAEKGFPAGEEVNAYSMDLPSLTVKEFGKGKVAAVATDLSAEYAGQQQSRITDLYDSVLVQMYDPRVRIEESRGPLEIVDLWKDGRMLVQLVNAGGLHHANNSLIEKSIAPVTDIRLKIRYDEKPSVLRLQPEGTKLDFEWKDGYALVSVPRVDFHAVIAAE